MALVKRHAAKTGTTRYESPSYLETDDKSRTNWRDVLSEERRADPPPLCKTLVYEVRDLLQREDSGFQVTSRMWYRDRRPRDRLECRRSRIANASAARVRG